MTGVWTTALIAFMLLTGLPWAGVEGALLQRVSAAAGVGYPPAHFTHNVPASVPMKRALGVAPWTLETMPMPVSGPAPEHAGHAGHGMPAGVNDDGAIEGADTIVAALAGRDHLAGGYRLFLPSSPTGVYTAYTYPDRPQGQRTLYFDRWTKRRIREVDYADYGWVGRMTELGVQLHMGNYFGRANQLLMLIPCLGVIALVVSGVSMWWKRRPRGKLGAPPRPGAGRLPGLLIILALAGVAMPLLGASLLAILCLDRLVVMARFHRGVMC